MFELLKTKKGYYYILTVLCCCGMAMTTVGICVYTMGVFYTPMAKSLQVGVGDIAIFVTLNQFVAGIMGPLLVKFCMRGNFRLVVGLGFVLCVSSLVGMSQITAIWQLYVFGFLCGFGKTFCGAMMFAMILSNWFKKGMGISLGIVYGTSGLTSVILSPVITSVIESADWRTAGLVMGIIAAVLLLPMLLLLKRNPSDVGLEPYGAGEEAQEEKQEDKPKEAPAQISLTKDRTVRKAFIAMVFIYIFVSVIVALGSHFSAFAQSLNYSAATGSLIMSVVMVSNTGSKMIMGFLCDKFGAKRSALFMLSLATVGCIFLTFTSHMSIYLLAVGAFLFGLSFSVSAVSNSIVLREVFGAENFGRVYSYANLFGLMGNALSLSLYGYSYDLTGSYVPASALCMVLGIISIFLIVFVYRQAKKRKIASQISDQA